LADQSPKSIVVLGAGVAGLRVALDLDRRTSPYLSRIVLIDENDYHQYLHRLHEVCNIDYEEKNIIVHIPRLIRGTRIEFLRSKVENIDPNRRIVETADGEEPFDVLVIALGSHVAYFNIEGLKENCLTLNSFEAANVIRAKIESMFNEATGNPPRIVIGGGGYTGVELVGELTDWIPILCEEQGLDPPEHLVTVVEAMPSILPGWNMELVEKAQEILRRRGVELILDDPVLRVSKSGIELRSGRKLEHDLFIWTGGVRGDPACGVGFDVRGGRILIDKFCRAWGFKDIYVAGDISCAIDEETGRPVRPTAHVAMEQAKVVAHNIKASLEGGEIEEYVYEFYRLRR
jgi:NADH dehydrogenase